VVFIRYGDRAAASRPRLGGGTLEERARDRGRQTRGYEGGDAEQTTDEVLNNERSMNRLLLREQNRSLGLDATGQLLEKNR